MKSLIQWNQEILQRKFGSLSVVELFKTNDIIADVLCDCGNRKLIRLSSLTCGNSRSCGCVGRNTAHKQAQHGKVTPEYRSWQKAKGRCYDENNDHYYNYGGRGISMCERWINSFELFFNDMGKKPSPTHTLDRIDCNGNYSPENCRWATKKEQTRNRRNSLRLKVLMPDGTEKDAIDLCEISGVSYQTAVYRIKSGRDPYFSCTEKNNLLRKSL